MVEKARLSNKMYVTQIPFLNLVDNIQLDWSPTDRAWNQVVLLSEMTKFTNQMRKRNQFQKKYLTHKKT